MQRQLQDEMKDIQVLVFCATYIKGFTVIHDECGWMFDAQDDRILEVVAV